MVMADTDGGRWTLIGSTANDLIGGEEWKELPEQNQARIRAAAYRAYYNNPHGRGILRNLTNFVLGKGAEIVYDSDLSEAELKPVKEEWELFCKAVKWRRKQRETVRRTFRDGECFHHFIEAEKSARKKEPKTVTFHYLDPDWIQSKDPSISHGIETDKQDVSKVISYRLRPPGFDKEDIKLEPGKVQHIKINVDENVKRGRSELEPIFEDLEEYKQFRHFRVVLNKFRAAIVFVRKMTGATSQLQSQVNAQRVARPGETGNKLKAPQPGTQITIDRDSEVEFKSPNLGASEAAVDGRMLVLSMASGVSLPEFVVSGDASNNNFASIKQAIVTAIKYIEDMQAFFGEEFEEVFNRVVQGGKDAGRIPQHIEAKASFEFPAFDIRSLKDDAEAYNLLRGMGVVSKSKTAGHFGFNFEEEAERMEKDDRLTHSATKQYVDDLEAEDEENNDNEEPNDPEK